MKEQGMGRVRITRFAALTVPAGIASVGLGVAIVQGMVAATLSSADGFELNSNKITATSLSMRAGVTQAGTTTNNVGTALARVDTASLDKMCVGVNQAIPLIGRVGLKIDSSDSSIGLDTVDLNARSLDTATSSLTNTTIGMAQSGTSFAADSDADKAATGYDPTGFAMRSGGAAGDISLANVAAKSYAVTLAGGLTLDALKIGLTQPATADSAVCGAAGTLQ